MEWNIQSRAHACQGCSRAFAKGEALHTLLFDERGAYQRLDVCEACWQSQHAQGSNHRRGFVSHWQGVYEPPPSGPPDPIQKETAETLLRKLIERNDPQHAGAVFILAVMLERKRILKSKAENSASGHRVLVYEHARTGDVFTVPDPGLHLGQLEAVQHDVALLLERGLPEESPAAPPPPETSTAGEVPAHNTSPDAGQQAAITPETLAASAPVEDPVPAAPPR